MKPSRKFRPIKASALKTPKPDSDDRYRETDDAQANRKIREPRPAPSLAPDAPIEFFSKASVEERVQSFITSRMLNQK